MRNLYTKFGLAYAANKIVFGTDNIINGIKTKKVSLIIMSSKCSFNTQKLIQDKAQTYPTDILVVDEYDQDSITKAVGKDNVKIIGIKDKGFKRIILKSIKGETKWQK